MTREDLGFLFARVLSFVLLMKFLEGAQGVAYTLGSRMRYGTTGVGEFLLPLPVLFVYLYLAAYLWFRAPAFGRWLGRGDSAPSILSPKEVVRTASGAIGVYALVSYLSRLAMDVALQVSTRENEPLVLQSRHAWIADAVGVLVAVVAILYATQPRWLTDLLNPLPDDEPQ